MWAKTFDQRLNEWYSLRTEVSSIGLESSLLTINAWWHTAPWTAYYMHWDDCESWPDPWQLLDDNVFCDVARGLGILYTITMLDREDVQNASLVHTDDGYNLVLIPDTDYILNWDKDSVFNSNLNLKIQRRLTQSQIKQKYL